MAIPFLIAAQHSRRSGLALHAPMPAPAGYQSGGGHRGASAGLSLGLTALMLTGLASALVVPQVLRPTPGPTTVVNIPAPQVEPPPPPPPQSTIDPPAPQLTRQQIPTIPLGDPFPMQLTPPIGPTDIGPILPIARNDPPPQPPRDPVLTGASRDPRFAGAFQPPYPAARQREGAEGYCRVSVSITPAGRVSAVRAVDCPDDAFFRATERQALRHWRFRPATRDGVAVETSIEQNVRFQIIE